MNKPDERKRNEKEIIADALVPNLNIPKSEEGNIHMVCKDCYNKMFPKKGSYTEADMQRCEYIKAGFGVPVEHMWVRVTKVTPLGVHGEIDNMPILPASPAFGQQVFVLYKDIEAVC